MTTSTESLKQKIENAVQQLVREHLVALEAAASAAVHEGFRRAIRPTTPSSRDGGSAPRRRSPSRRRPRVEMAQLEARLYAAICAHPGETMTVLAPAVGLPARDLGRPATLLRRSGRVRSVGERQYTRYFPMGE